VTRRARQSASANVSGTALSLPCRCHGRCHGPSRPRRRRSSKTPAVALRRRDARPPPQSRPLVAAATARFH
jgi:hypothetical protein